MAMWTHALRKKRLNSILKIFFILSIHSVFIWIGALLRSLLPQHHLHYQVLPCNWKMHALISSSSDGLCTLFSHLIYSSCHFCRGRVLGTLGRLREQFHFTWGGNKRLVGGHCNHSHQRQPYFPTYADSAVFPHHACMQRKRP